MNKSLRLKGKTNIIILSILCVIAFAVGFVGVFNNNIAKAENEVAQIGDTKYETLTEAIANVPTNNTETTIKLLADISVSDRNIAFTIEANKNIVLDLNGFVISHTMPIANTGATIINYGKLTIEDNSTNKNGKITATGTPDPSWNYGLYTIDNRKDIVVNSGTIEYSGARGLTFALSSGSYGSTTTTEINGGTIISTNYCAFQMYYNNSGSHTTEINDGTIQGGTYPIWYHVATDNPTMSMVINGGTITFDYSNSTHPEYTPIYFYNYGEYDVSNATVEINGGKFIGGPNSTKVVNWSDTKNANKKVIKGGVYSISPASDEVVDGYEITSNNDATYLYKVNAKVSVAQIDGTKYSTLAEAVEAADYGDTIKLIADISVDSGGATIEKSVNVNLNGYTLTITGNNKGDYGIVYDGYEASDDHSVRIKGEVYGGTIICHRSGVYAADHADVVVRDLTVIESAEGELNFPQTALAASYGSTLTVESGSYSGRVGIGIFSTGGKIIINGGTIEGSYYAAQVYNPESSASESNSEVIIHGGTISGEIQIVPGKPYGSFTTDIDIDGGIFSVAPNADYIADGYNAIENDNWYGIGIDTKTQTTQENSNIAIVDISNESDLSEQETVVETVENVINNNKPVKNFSSSNIEKATYKNTTNGDINLDLIKTELKKETDDNVAKENIENIVNNNVSSRIVVDTKTAKVKISTSNVVRAMVFDVKPMATVIVTNTNGEEETISSVIPNEAITSPITFRLPVDSSINSGVVAKVYHEGAFYGNYLVKEENGEKYLEVSASSFSEYSYELQGLDIGANYSLTLSLNDNFDINFYMIVPTGTNISNYRVKSTFNGETYANNVELAWVRTYNGKDEYKVKVAKVYSLQMNIKAHIELLDNSLSIDDKVVKMFDYSVKDYLLAMLDVDDDVDNIALYKATLDYGANAQLYFSGRTYGEDLEYEEVSSASDLVNYTINPNNNIEVPNKVEVDNYTIINNISTASVNGVSLILGSEVSIKVKIIDSSCKTVAALRKKYGDDVEIDSNTLNVSLKVENINVADYDKAQTFEFSDGKNTLTVTYAVYNYIKNKISGSGQIAKLCSAMYNYSQAVKTAFDID